MGSFGVVYYYFRWLADYSDDPPALQLHWNHDAWELRKSAFCQECSGTTALFSRPGSH
jgi:hypothetical protein